MRFEFATAGRIVFGAGRLREAGDIAKGLKSGQTPLLGRILAVTDAYSAMTTDRPCRKGPTVSEAIAELQRVAGKQLDPELVPLFIEVIEEEESRLVTVRATVV